MKYITYDKNGRIIGRGSTQTSAFAYHCKHLPKDIYAMPGCANDLSQKIVFDGFDAESKQPVNPRIVNMTGAEIKANKIMAEAAMPQPVPIEKQQANITNEQWQGVLDRLTALEHLLTP